MARLRRTTVTALRKEVHKEVTGAPVDPLPALRAALEQQLRFRREQLAVLQSGGREGLVHHDRGEAAVYGHGEVDALVAAGARRALADIELALTRMRTGRYGYCRSCGARIPLVVLQAIPKTTLCLACQQPEGRGDGPAVPAARGTARHRGDASTERRNGQRRQRRAATAGPAKRSEAR
jgi:DnaK suppressor protein